MSKTRTQCQLKSTFKIFSIVSVCFESNITNLCFNCEFFQIDPVDAFSHKTKTQLHTAWNVLTIIMYLWLFCWNLQKWSLMNMINKFSFWTHIHKQTHSYARCCARCWRWRCCSSNVFISYYLKSVLNTIMSLNKLYYTHKGERQFWKVKWEQMKWMLSLWCK